MGTPLTVLIKIKQFLTLFRTIYSRSKNLKGFHNVVVTLAPLFPLPNVWQDKSKIMKHVFNSWFERIYSISLFLADRERANFKINFLLNVMADQPSVNVHFKSNLPITQEYKVFEYFLAFYSVFSVFLSITCLARFWFTSEYRQFFISRALNLKKTFLRTEDTI